MTIKRSMYVVRKRGNGWTCTCAAFVEYFHNRGMECEHIKKARAAAAKPKWLIFDRNMQCLICSNRTFVNRYGRCQSCQEQFQARMEAAEADAHCTVN